MNASRLKNSRRALATALVLAGLGSAWGVPPTASATPTVSPGFASAVDVSQRVGGARIVDEERLSDRVLQLTIDTNAFAAPVPVRVLLPTGYDARRGQRFPVIYYTAGTNSDEARFPDAYGGVELTRNLPAIVVAPRGDSGYWSDWTGPSLNGPHRYETFVTRQLVPVIDARFRTLARRSQRAIVGESMGGFGAVMLAARNPHLFVATASLSGAVDTNQPPIFGAVTASPTVQGEAPAAIYGPRATDEVRWRGHNPVDLAGNLQGLDIQVFTGNGVPDPARGETAADAGGCAIEVAVQSASRSLHDELIRHDINHRFVDFPWGCHSVPLFQKGFSLAATRILRVFAANRRAPRTFDLAKVEPAFGAYGWRVRADRARAPEFLQLTGVNRAGLVIRGTGRTSLTTPAWGRRVRAVRVTVNGKESVHEVGRDRRLRFSVALGPATTEQQYTNAYVDRRRAVPVRLQPLRTRGTRRG